MHIIPDTSTGTDGCPIPNTLVPATATMICSAEEAHSEDDILNSCSQLLFKQDDDWTSTDAQMTPDTASV